MLDFYMDNGCLSKLRLYPFSKTGREKCVLEEIYEKYNARSTHSQSIIFTEVDKQLRLTVQGSKYSAEGYQALVLDFSCGYELAQKVAHAKLKVAKTDSEVYWYPAST